MSSSAKRRFGIASRSKGAANPRANPANGASLPATTLGWVFAGEVSEIQELERELAAARAELETEQARYRDLFDLNPDAHLVTDARGVISEVNLATAILLNVPSQYLVGKPLAVYVVMEDRLILREMIRKMRTNDIADLTARIMPRGMGTRIASIRVAATRDEIWRTLLGMRWIVRDVTEARAAQEELAGSREKLRELTSELSLAEERVRREIAIGIHDRVSQPLALAKMLLGKIKVLSKVDKFRDVEELNLLLQQAIDESRTLTFEVSPPVLYELGLPSAVEWLAEQMQRRHRLKIRALTECFTKPIRIDLRVLLFQSIRELLTNVIKHAAAKSVTIVLRRDDGMVQAVVSDDGAGFDPAALKLRPQPPGGFGLFSIRTRVEHVGGQFTIESKPRRGTRMIIVLPSPPEPPANAGSAG